MIKQLPVASAIPGGSHDLKAVICVKFKNNLINHMFTFVFIYTFQYCDNRHHSHQMSD